MAEFDSWTAQRWQEDQNRYCDTGPHEGKIRVIGALYMTAEEFGRYQRHPDYYLPLEIREPEEK